MTAATRSVLGGLRPIVETFVLTIVAFFVIQTFIAQPFQVQQHSMERTFAPGDYVLVDRLSHLWSAYARGQVIVFNPPPGASTRKDPFIKRVIGVAGDKIELRDGRVFVNGAALAEPYLYRDAAGATEPTEPADATSWTVPDGQLFVMGDHRMASSDSRVFGPIAVESVIGRGLVRYWPLSSVGIVGGATYENVPAP